MNIQELRMLNNEIISDEQFEQIEEMENVTVQSNGISGSHIGYNWYTVIIENGTDIEEIEIFL